MLAVKGEHRLVEPSEFVPVETAVILALRVDRLFQHRLRAAADQILRAFDRHRGEAAQRQRVIDRRAEVAMGFEESAVEVEADDVERKIAHAADRCRMRLQTASLSWQGANP